MGRVVKLIEVTVENNNKFYSMVENSDGSTWTATWGRVGGTSSTMNYPMSQWDKKYREKLRKGYRDVTDLVSVETSEPDTPLVSTSSPTVRELVEFLQSCAKGTIKRNYTVAVADVTERQIAVAQTILDNLASFSVQPSFDVTEINRHLIELYTTIPRKMSDVRLYLAKEGTQEELRKFLTSEQDLLDVMQGQVTTVSKSTAGGIDLSALGLVLEDATTEDRDRISRETDFKLSPAQRVFKAINRKTEASFVSGSNMKLLWHGSRNENYWSILNNGLLIRPTGVAHSGSMFGNGVYAANKAQKSIGYTSLSGSYWASGSSRKAFLTLFDFNLGNEWNLIGPGRRYEGWMSSIDLTRVRREGYDSVYAKGGADLRNDEYIVYETNRSTIRYLIELTT